MKFARLVLDGTCMVDKDEPATISHVWTTIFLVHQLVNLNHAQNYSMLHWGESKPRNKKEQCSSQCVPTYHWIQMVWTMSKIISKSWFYKPIRDEIQLLSGHNTLTEAYAEYLNTVNVPLGWNSPIRHTAQVSNEENENSDEAEASTCTYSVQESRTRHVGVICQHRA